MMYYRLSFIASSLLLLLLAPSPTALTVVDTKTSPIKGSKTHIGIRMPVVAKSSNACCPDFPYCGCPKLDTPTPTKASTKKQERIHQIKLPAVAKQNQISNSCCPDYPYCGCPKLQSSVEQIKLKDDAAATAAAKEHRISNACCADYPYCGCPKLEADTVEAQRLNWRNAGVVALRATRQ